MLCLQGLGLSGLVSGFVVQGSGCQVKVLGPGGLQQVTEGGLGIGRQNFYLRVEGCKIIRGSC